MYSKKEKISWSVVSSWKSLSFSLKRKGIISISVPFATSYLRWVSERSFIALRVKPILIITDKLELNMLSIDPGIWRNSSLLLEKLTEFLGEKSIGRFGPIFKSSNVTSAISTTTSLKWATVIFTSNREKSKCLLMDQWVQITNTHAAKRKWTSLKSWTKSKSNRTVVKSKSIKYPPLIN